MPNVRRDLELEEGLVLVVQAVDEHGPFFVRLARKKEGRLVYATPRFEVVEGLAHRFRAEKGEVRARFEDPRLAGPLAFCSDEEGLEIEWEGRSYRVARLPWLRAISNRGANDVVPTPSERRIPDGEPPDESKDLSVSEGVLLRIERRGERILVSLQRRGRISSPAILKPSLDLRYPTTYTWLNEGSVAVRLVGGDRLRVFSCGETVGHVSLEDLRRTIRAIGGEVGPRSYGQPRGSLKE